MIRPRRPARPLGIGLLLLLAALPGLPGPAGAEFTRGVIWYTRAADRATLERAAARYDLGITGRDVADVTALKAIDPGFRWFVYNSVTDNYVPPHTGGTPEDDALGTLARSRGWDPEEAYLHYYEDTVVILRGDTLLVPGWPEGRATRPEDARIPVYSPDLTRRATHFATPRAASLHRKVILDQAFGIPFEGSAIYPDGLFLDNSAAELFNFGTVLSGGRVRETPEHFPIQSPAFRYWHWNHNLGPFLTALRDTLATASSWSRDGRRKELMINVANVWEDDYVASHVADILFLEFQYNPVRNFGVDRVAEAHRRDALAATKGMATFYAPAVITKVSGVDGAVPHADALMGNLAWYLVTRSDRSIFFEMGSSTPHLATWDSLTWTPGIEVAAQQLGNPTAPPEILARGRDPRGNAFVVTARRYEGGLAVIRNRGDWNQGFGPDTGVQVSLPAPMAPLEPTGRVGTVRTEVTLINGEGRVFLGDPGPPPPN